MVARVETRSLVATAMAVTAFLKAEGENFADVARRVPLIIAVEIVLNDDPLTGKDGGQAEYEEREQELGRVLARLGTLGL